MVDKKPQQMIKDSGKGISVILGSRLESSFAEAED